MKIRMNKKIAIVLAALILTLSVGSVAFAASGYKDLKAWYNNIKIFKNGQQVQLDFEPFIIDGYTYVPLRAVGELFNKDFDWDGVNYTINIKDRPDANLNNMMKQIVDQQVTISTLEAKIKSLEAELDKKPTVSSLSDLKKQLNKDWGKYSDVQFDIDLYESKGNIEVRIYIDTWYDGNAWNKISTNNRTKYLQNIVNDITKNYKDVNKITGFIEDTETDKEVLTFTTSSKGTVSVTTKGSGGSSSSANLKDLENSLYKEYKDDMGIVNIILSWNKDDIEVAIYVDYKYFKNYEKGEIKEYLEEIYDDIVYKYSDAYVDGYIEDDDDGYTFYQFEFDSKGNIKLY